jgi:hypothetical protein
MISLKRVLLLGALIAGSFLWGCSDQKSPPVSKVEAGIPKQNGIAVSGCDASPLSVTILPASPTVNDTLRAVVKGANGVLSFYWERNGEVIEGGNTDILPKLGFVKDEVVSVSVKAGDKAAAASATIVNSPPQVTAVSFQDPHIHRGVDIAVVPEAVDFDGDQVSFRYVWSINGEKLLCEDSPVLPGDRFRKGDRISLKVIPFDVEGEGRVFKGREFSIPNAPPLFVSSPPLKFKANSYSYDAHAEDPDGDILTYSLESAPLGMSIDNRRGSIRWQIGKKNAGEHHIKIAAEDEEGSRAFQEYLLTITNSE